MLIGVLNIWDDNNIKGLCRRSSPLTEFGRFDCEGECDIRTPTGWGCCHSLDEPKVEQN